MNETHQNELFSAATLRTFQRLGRAVVIAALFVAALLAEARPVDNSRNVFSTTYWICYFLIVGAALSGVLWCSSARTLRQRRRTPGGMPELRVFDFFIRYRGPNRFRRMAPDRVVEQLNQDDPNQSWSYPTAVPRPVGRGM